MTNLFKYTSGNDVTVTTRASLSTSSIVTTQVEAKDTTSVDTLLPLLGTNPEETLHVITGNLLGDGCIRRTGRKVDGQPTGNARFEMNKSVPAYDHVLGTFNKYYKQFSGVGFRENNYYSTSLQIHVTQFHIFTKTLPVFFTLHSLWYQWDIVKMKYIKVVPQNISSMFSPLSLAHWIMDDGYYTDKTLVLCTDNFTREECVRLQALLLQYSILTGLIVQSGKFRIRVYRGSMPRVISLVRPHMHPAFIYKLGLI